MKIRVYQIPEEKDRRNLLFRRYAEVERRGGVNPREYEKVFDGDVNTEDLEYVYVLCNNRTTMPEGYRGRSLSVSDIVCTDTGTYYCDVFGFHEIEGLKMEV